MTDPDNQPPPFEDVDLLATDRALAELAGDDPGLAAFAVLAGSARAAALAREANANPPVLDAANWVDYAPAYHELMAISCGQGLHYSGWSGAGHGARAARFYLAAQMEAGHCCPVTMTHAALAALAAEPDLDRQWRPHVARPAYDPEPAPAAAKRGVLIGMGMTEKQGGSDVRTNRTRAEPAGNGGEYRISGEKWFMSAPNSDAFLVLAQAPGGLTCFLMPRLLPDDSANGLLFRRLKPKLGNHSNASAEVEFDGALAWRVGEEGRGVNAIIPMVTSTRLDCALSSAGLMRQAVAHALHHVRHRVAFGRPLARQPLMVQVLADMALDQEAAMRLAFRLARAFDRAPDEAEAAFARLMTPVVKFWVCKLLPGVAAEALECLGGNGYVEDFPLARLYREAPINALWEGSGNVMGLDLLRVVERSPQSAALVLDGLAALAASEPRLAARVEALRTSLAPGRLAEADLRRAMEDLATVAAACLLVAEAPGFVAEDFLATRLAGPPTATYGAAPLTHAGDLFDRAMPG